MDPISMATLSGAAKAAKAVFNLAKGVDKSELRAELLGAVIELQEKILELQVEMGSLLDENRSLKEAAALNDMEFKDDGMYWDGDEGPYCPTCIPKGVAARVSRSPGGHQVCNVCHRSPIGAPLPEGR